jgi:hypothetical protein
MNERKEALDTFAFGKMGGRIWIHLSRAGGMPLTELAKEKEVESRIAHQAVGRLSRECKLAFDIEGGYFE